MKGVGLAQRQNNGRNSNLTSSLDAAKRTARRRTPEVRAADEAASRRRVQARQQPRTTRTILAQNMVGILSVVAVALVVAVIVVLVGAVGGAGDSKKEEILDPSDPAFVYESPYNWKSLRRDPEGWNYSVNGEVVSRLGIDVSDHQGWIDWQAVASEGVDFAIIRLGYRGTTEGGIYLDDYFFANLEGAKQAGIDRGVYFFSQATSVEEAIEEADFVLDQLDGAELEYPIAFDSEEVSKGNSRTSDLSREEMTAIAEAFCNRVEQAGYRSMVYGNAYDLSRYRYASMASRTLWWAEYNAPTPTANIDFAIWQYSNVGVVAGIDVHVDVNIDLSAALEMVR